MTDSHYIKRQRERTLEALRSQVTPIYDPLGNHMHRSLDPGTDRDMADDCCIGAYTASLSMAACGVLSHSDDELMSELPDLRAIAEALLSRVEKLGG